MFHETSDLRKENDRLKIMLADLELRYDFVKKLKNAEMEKNQKKLV